MIKIIEHLFNELTHQLTHHLILRVDYEFFVL